MSLMKILKIFNRKNIFSSINAIIPILLAFLIGAIAIWIAKGNPLHTYWVMIRESLFDYRGVMRTLHVASPLILAGLAIGISFKAGLFNMGIEGQIISSGFVVAVLGYRLADLPTNLLIPFLLFAGMLVGVLVALVPAILKSRYNVNEMVVTLLLNYAIIELLEYLTSNVFRDPTSGYVSTNMIGQAAIMKRIFDSRLTTFFFVAMIAFVIITIVMKKSKLGYEITAMGKNKVFAESTGMNLKKKIVVIMLISGALAGLAGAGWMLSDKYAYTLSFSGVPGLGWDGMLISLLGNHHPIGIFISAIFYAVLKTGSSNVAIYTSVPAEIIALIQAFIILFLSLKVYVRYTAKKQSKATSVKEA